MINLDKMLGIPETWREKVSQNSQKQPTDIVHASNVSLPTPHFQKPNLHE